MRSYRIGRWGLGWSVALSLLLSGTAMATPASVLDVVAVANDDGTYGFNVTVAHQDEGWTHYANKWEVVTPDGKVIATRIIYHPHVDEQPFMRTLASVAVPIGVTRVTVRAYDTVTGPGERTFSVDLPPRK